MKTVLLHDYVHKKLIADNLQKLINERYTEISDEEYSRINTAIDSYNEAIQELYDHLHDITFTEQQKSQLLLKIERIETDIKSLKENMFDVNETGLYFTDEEGNIGAKIVNTGLYAINLDGSGSTPSDMSLNNLTDVTITSPSSGQELQYNGSLWRNVTPSGGGGTSDLTVIDY